MLQRIKELVSKIASKFMKTAPAVAVQVAQPAAPTQIKSPLGWMHPTDFTAFTAGGEEGKVFYLNNDRSRPHLLLDGKFMRLSLNEAQRRSSN